MAAAPPEIVEFYREQLAEGLGPVEVRRLFGGWGLRSDGHLFAVFLGGSLFLVADGPLREELSNQGSRAFRYRKQGKWVTVGRFQSVPEAALDDPEALLAWARRARAVAARGKA